MSDRHIEVNARAHGLRGVVLDYGEVLCHRPKPEHLARMADALGLETTMFAARYEQERWLYDRGDLTPEDYWSRVVGDSIEHHRELLGKLRHWDVEMWTDLNQDMLDWLDSLRQAGFKTAILSNMHPDMAAQVRRSSAWRHRLDCLVLSCELHLAKPEPAIYQHCLDCLKLRPHEVIFIDDREPNVAAARAVGLLGLKFESVERLRIDLAGCGFEVLP